MKSYLKEDQYRVVGTMDATGTSRVSWYDTAQQAIEVAFTYDRAVVLRPDGSLVGEYFSRMRPPPPRMFDRPLQEQVNALFDLERDAALSGIPLVMMRDRAVAELARFETYLRGVTHLSPDHRQRRDLLAAVVMKYEQDHRRATNRRGMSPNDPEGGAEEST